jgi:DNA-binding XRE family transcriptional regulator
MVVGSPDLEMQRLGNEIRRARRAAGLTQDELGAFIDADRFAVANLERGVVTTQLRRLLQAFDAVGLELSVRRRTERLAFDAAEAADSATGTVRQIGAAGRRS